MSLFLNHTKEVLPLHKHPFEQLLHRRQSGDDDAENRIHADGEEIVGQRIRPEVAKAVIRRIGGEEHGSPDRGGDHPRKAADRRTQREILGKEARQTQTRKRHEVVEDELHGVQDVSTLRHLQQRERKRRGEAVERAEVGRVDKDRQHRKQRDRSAQRQGEELEVAQHERERDRQRAVDEHLRAAGLARGLRRGGLCLGALGIGRDRPDQ